MSITDYFLVGEMAARLLAACALLAASVAADVTVPEQVHIALAGRDAAGNPNGMAVSWFTASETPSSLRYGTGPEALDQLAYGHSKAYLEGFHHHVVLGPLQPSTTYHFQIFNEHAQSKLFSFVSAPAPQPSSGKPQAGFSVAIFGDMGVVNSEGTYEQLRAHQDDFDLIWHIGDISYADDWFIRGLRNLVTFGYEKTYNEYMNMMEPVTAEKPWMVLPGNHEDSCHSPACILSLHNLYHTLRNFTAYNARFRMPSMENGGTSNMWYSFNYGPVHFVSLNTETDYPGSPEGRSSLWGDGGFGDQLAWLRKDLEQAQKERTLRPWVLAAGHRPLYTVGTVDAEGNPAGYAKTLQQAVEDLFHEFGVDVYFAGHVHACACGVCVGGWAPLTARRLPDERHYPVYQNKVFESYDDPPYTTHVVVGCAGNVESHESMPSRVPAWNAFKVRASTADSPRATPSPASMGPHPNPHPSSSCRMARTTGSASWM